MSAATAMLEIPGVRARFSPITVAEFHRLSEYNASGRRTELIRGIVVEKRSKSPLHSSIARRLYRLLQAALPLDFTLLREDPQLAREARHIPRRPHSNGYDSVFG